MKTTDLITDAAIAIVFENTNFGSRDHREVISTNLQNVSDGYTLRGIWNQFMIRNML